MTSTNRRVTAIAAGQHGIVSRAAAHAAGVSDAALRSRVESGFLVQVGAHTFRLAGSARDAVDHLRGVLADVGPPAWACGATAAALHGFDGWALHRPFHILLPRGRYVPRSAVTLHTSDDLPPIDLEEQLEVAVTSPTRTIIDLAAASTRDQLAVALDSALRDGLTSESLVHRRIVALRGKGRRGLPALVDVLDGRDVVRGGHSWLEREFLHLLARAGLPRPVTQQVLARAGGRVVRVDCRFPDTVVVVELLGHRFHRSRQQMRRDVERLNALTLAGLVPFQFTYDMVVGDPVSTLRTVRQALACSTSAKLQAS